MKELIFSNNVHPANHPSRRLTRRVICFVKPFQIKIFSLSERVFIFTCRVVFLLSAANHP